MHPTWYQIYLSTFLRIQINIFSWFLILRSSCKYWLYSTNCHWAHRVLWKIKYCWIIKRLIIWDKRHRNLNSLKFDWHSYWKYDQLAEASSKDIYYSIELFNWLFSSIAFNCRRMVSLCSTLECHIWNWQRQVPRSIDYHS